MDFYDAPSPLLVCLSRPSYIGLEAQGRYFLARAHHNGDKSEPSFSTMFSGSSPPSCFSFPRFTACAVPLLSPSRPLLSCTVVDVPNSPGLWGSAVLRVSFAAASWSGLGVPSTILLMCLQSKHVNAVFCLENLSEFVVSSHTSSKTSVGVVAQRVAAHALNMGQTRLPICRSNQGPAKLLCPCGAVLCAFLTF